MFFSNQRKDCESGCLSHFTGAFGRAHANSSAVIRGRLKLIRTEMAIRSTIIPNTEIVELFNLAKDPYEMNDLSERRPGLVNSLSRELDLWEGAGKRSQSSLQP